ncbi:hypothetical protein MPH_00873 [Macrophomina phaseolina MS6]|uniref:Uncharacterized protein n=1 Tax=Macrophomina phaseolina (strain MS6) TaxID=1126212 RepID=K2SAN1_MACPH|nr:hypothetical protein MPH_00873 [Macrophomina phaseolina MS6]
MCEVRGRLEHGGSRTGEAAKKGSSESELTEGVGPEKYPQGGGWWWTLRTAEGERVYWVGSPAHEGRGTGRLVVVNGSPLTSSSSASREQGETRPGGGHGGRAPGNRSPGASSQVSRGSCGDGPKSGAGSEPAMRDDLEISCQKRRASEVCLSECGPSISSIVRSPRPALRRVGSMAAADIRTSSVRERIDTGLASASGKTEITSTVLPSSPSLIPRPLFSTPGLPPARPARKPPAHLLHHCFTKLSRLSSTIISSLRPLRHHLRWQQPSTSNNQSPSTSTHPIFPAHTPPSTNPYPTVPPNTDNTLRHALHNLSDRRPSIAPAAPLPAVGTWTHHAPTSYIPLPIPDPQAVVSGLIEGARKVPAVVSDHRVREATVAALGDGLKVWYEEGGSDREGGDLIAPVFWKW